MHSAADTASGGEDSDPDEQLTMRDAQSLLREHGEEADTVAAHRADVHFQNGDAIGGTRWLKVFRRIAMAHRKRAIG